MTMDKLSVLEDSNAIPSHVQAYPLQAQNSLKLGDTVTFYDEKGNPVIGIVRWIGINREVLQDGAKIVGIETVRFMQ